MIADAIRVEIIKEMFNEYKVIRNKVQHAFMIFTKRNRFIAEVTIIDADCVSIFASCLKVFLANLPYSIKIDLRDPKSFDVARKYVNLVRKHCED